VDNICNGADDDASGTTGLMMVAEAWGKMKVKPRRSMIILNVSGEEKGLLGSAWYADHPTVPADKIVANVNMDMIGRNATDSIVVIGKEHSNLGQTLAAVQARHPELKLTAADDIWPEEGFYSRSDHFMFARKGVPVLFFFNGVHPQYHRPNDEVPLIDTSKLARVAQLGFYFGVDIANGKARPQWNPDSYQLIVVEQKTPPVTRRPTP
jgi:Zn-dependent M28 family amino/carboxypeptidase